MEKEQKEKIKNKYQEIVPYLTERTKRIWAAIEAKSLGRGGITVIGEITGLSRTTIYIGMQEVEGNQNREKQERIRSKGAGRKQVVQSNPRIVEELEALLEPVTLGDPETPLRWTSKSTVKLAQELKKVGIEVSQRTVYSLLKQQGYSLQANRKTKEGQSHPDRDEQFLYISKKIKEFQAIGQPVISVDAKKKELVGEFKNQGKEWHKKGQSPEVEVYDFVKEELGKVAPYGVYDLARNNGWVSVGIEKDTAEFAVESIRRWWKEMGKPLYPKATKVLITADCGGSNGYRVRLWKLQLQKLATEVGLSIDVCHFPPGTSKWNKIEHRLFCHISQNWRGRPLVSREVVVNLISNTTTSTGLAIKAALDLHSYPIGIKVSDQDFSSILIEKELFHGEWNYTISPFSNP